MVVAPCPRLVLSNFPGFKFFMNTLIVTLLEQLCGILPPPTNEAHFALSTHICLIFIWSSNEWIFFVVQLKLLCHISFFCILLFYVPGLASSGQFSKSNCWEKLTCVKQSMLHRWILLLLFILLKSVATDIFILFLTIQ